jgi:hypothetical protein
MMEGWLKEWANCVTVMAEFAAAMLLIVLSSHVPAWVPYELR